MVFLFYRLEHLETPLFISQDKTEYLQNVIITNNTICEVDLINKIIGKFRNFVYIFINTFGENNGWYYCLGYLV